MSDPSAGPGPERAEAPESADLQVRRLVVGPLQSNCYLVRGARPESAVVVDPGDEPERVIRALEAWGATPTDILLTHAHMDHVGGVAGLVRRYGCPVHLHPDDLPLYERAAEHAASFGLRMEAPPPPDRELADGDVVEAAGRRFGVRHAPGHSPGGVVLVPEEGGRAFVGDCVFAGSIGRTDLPGGHTATLLRSIRDHILSLPAETILHPGHGPETSVAREAAHNPFLAEMTEPCLRCGTRLPPRTMGCKGGRCPDCGHAYPHGDCSD